MSRYNKGDKFILEIDNLVSGVDGDMYYKTNLGNIMMNAGKLDMLQKYEEVQIPYSEAYNKGLEDAWELARKICGATNGQFDNYDTKELGAIFGKCGGSYIINENTYQEALAKIEAYEKEKAEIKVGDVVERIGTKNHYLIITEENDSSVYDFGVIDLDAMKVDRICNDTRYFKKTGKHIDIQSVLEQIGGKHG